MGEIYMKSKRLCLANGDELENVDIVIPQDMMDKFIDVKCGNMLIKVNSDFIISFETSPINVV